MSANTVDPPDITLTATVASLLGRSNKRREANTTKLWNTVRIVVILILLLSQQVRTALYSMRDNVAIWNLN